MDPKRFRSTQLSKLTNAIGVYALCDLDGVPVYVGQSVDGIRQRVQRHLTSARSDIIANRMIDVWEIAYVHAWPVAVASQIGELEAHLFSRFDPKVSS
jgi:Uri superfamily endonuclease